MHNRDNWLESLTAKPETRHTPFGIWLQISEALDKITYFYRPGADPSSTGWELGFPEFEEVLAEAGGEMDPPITGTTSPCNCQSQVSNLRNADSKFKRHLSCTIMLSQWYRTSPNQSMIPSARLPRKPARVSPPFGLFPYSAMKHPIIFPLCQHFRTLSLSQ